MDDVYKYFVTIMRQWAPETTLILQWDRHKIKQSTDGLTEERKKHTTQGSTSPIVQDE